MVVVGRKMSVRELKYENGERDFRNCTNLIKNNNILAYMMFIVFQSKIYSDLRRHNATCYEIVALNFFFR